jgi:hypothetical protein
MGGQATAYRNAYSERRGAGGGRLACIAHIRNTSLIERNGLLEMGRLQHMDTYIYIVSDILQEGAGLPIQPTVYDIIQSNGLQDRAGHNI